MSHTEPLLRHASQLLGTGCILYFFSEAMFWSQLRPDEELIDRPLSCVLYACLGYLTLVALWHLRIRDAPGCFSPVQPSDGSEKASSR